MSARSLLILPGDGIGPEVMAEVRRIIDWFGETRGLAFEVEEDLVGGAAYDMHGTPPNTDHTQRRAQQRCIPPLINEWLDRFGEE